MRKLALAALFCVFAAPLFAQDKGTIEKLNDALVEAFQ